MFKSKGEIALKTVLELICEHVWLTEHYRLGMPSLIQKIKLAERLERQVSFRQNTLYFDNSRERPNELHPIC